ncbi:iron-containing redox enzyme family protein [Pseudoalteromonas sp. S16_S37]|uniref:iron-containing redox enzyme family protein n=1 Tax=Pseudoalteromonas sp. S16_S37 TaxID=2720228 RepID=UPI00167FE4B9|nr:hypothetical protein [Pseudoalteromonas sp. S16_S37]
MISEDLKKIFIDIDSYIDNNRTSESSFIGKLEEGVNLTSFKNWAIQKYHQTYRQNCVFSAIHSNTQIEGIRQYMMEQLIGEETSICDGSDSHYNLMKRVALRAGATEEEIALSSPCEGVLNFTDYLIGICKNKHPVIAMLAIYVNEKQTPSTSIRAKDIIKDYFNFNDGDLEWFELHGTLDISHAEEGKLKIMEYSSTYENFMDEAMPTVINGVEQWKKLHSAYIEILNLK